ncbi:MAG: glycosyltransferase family 1 protein [Deltaproteobacteria bacterium]|nr:MAG: glycosyltransferase family 1 protein [Deltaproteobacteria bacterium]
MVFRAKAAVNRAHHASHSRPRLLYTATHAMTVRAFLVDQMRYMQSQGFDVTVACAPDRDLAEQLADAGIGYAPVRMNREMSPAADLFALHRMGQIVRRLRPDIVNAGTPKAGLLGMLAARAAHVPVRIYLLRGLRLEGEVGLRRALLAATERLACACAHAVVCVSSSVRDRAVALRLTPPARCVVLGAGASNGVDMRRFSWSEEMCSRARDLRSRYGIAPDAPVVGFVGRLCRDKGTPDLIHAFVGVRARIPRATLVLVGDWENERPARLPPGVVVTGFVEDTAPWYALMDVLAFPSYREGLPNVPLEAAAMGVPTAGYEATGTVDAVGHGEGGTLVPIGDADALARALLRYLEDPALRRAHGRAARARVARLFSHEKVWKAWRDEYNRLLARAGSFPGRGRRAYDAC